MEYSCGGAAGIVSRRNGLEEMDHEALKEAIRGHKCLQIHCDGGYCEGQGASAFVMHVVQPSTGAVSRIGFKWKYLAIAYSAFHAEITAIDLAVEYVNMVHRENYQQQLKRTRFS